MRMPYRPISDAARRESLRATLDAAPTPEQIWVFAYGSLMWNPEFRYVERRPGTVREHRRRLCVFSARARGTPERPGLGLGLERGTGECHGIVYRLHPENLENDLEALWVREMTTGIYQPHWLPVMTADGELRAITFVVDRMHPQYAEALPAQEMAAIIADARGHYGPCREYLENTIRELAALGVAEPEFDALLTLVQARESS